MSTKLYKCDWCAKEEYLPDVYTFALPRVKWILVEDLYLKTNREYCSPECLKESYTDDPNPDGN